MSECISRIGVLILSISLAVKPIRAAADFDNSAGQEGLAAYEQYQGEMKPRAINARDKVKADSVTHHPYFEGTTQQEVTDNNKFDIDMIRNDQTYNRCMQYEDIGTCITLNPDGTVTFDPYVRYWGPFMKGEEVPEAFRTGYMTKEQIKDPKKKALEDEPKYYDKFMKEIIPSEYKFGTEVTVEYLNKALGRTMTPPPEMTPRDDVLKATKDAIEKYGKNNFGEASMAQDGFVFNDYHLLPGDTNNWAMMKPPEIPEWGSKYFFCHNMKQVGSWYSEFVENRYYSRQSVASLEFFDTEMGIFKANPLTCLKFKGTNERTPQEVADVDRIGPANGAPCQGVNQGLWVPVTYRMHTQYQSTAAALGLTKSKIARAKQPDKFYNIDPKDDRVQWARNERMDGINSGKANPKDAGLDDVIDEKTKRCDKLAKWVMQYKKGNLKISPDEKKDYWHVLVHWRKIRCCVKPGGTPFILKPPYWADETLVPILE